MNGVPLRRVPQSYVIATQTKIDVGSLKVDKALNDDFFKRQKNKKKRGDDMFEQSVEVSNILLLANVFIPHAHFIDLLESLFLNFLISCLYIPTFISSFLAVLFVFRPLVDNHIIHLKWIVWLFSQVLYVLNIFSYRALI